MSLIPCGEDCRHQKEGYCALDRVIPLTSGASSVCGYYEALSAKEGEGLGNIRNRDEADSRRRGDALR